MSDGTGCFHQLILESAFPRSIAAPGVLNNIRDKASCRCSFSIDSSNLGDILIGNAKLVGSPYSILRAKIVSPDNVELTIAPLFG